MEKTTVQRVRGSMVSMLVIRPISAIGGLLVLVILSRTLSPTDYGLYFGLWAAAGILILASNFGLIHAVYRYISAKELLDGKLVPRGPILSLLAWRIATLSFATIGAALFPQVLTSIAGLPPFAEGVPLMFAVIVWGEGLAQFLESIFDSMLSQGRSQTTLGARTILRLGGVLYFLSNGSLSLTEVLYVEVAAALGGASIGLGLLGRIYWLARRTPKPEKEGSYSISRILKFTLPAFVAQLFGLIYGPDALKIALAKTTGIEAVAVFGFAYSLSSVIQRYMPANLFAGVFRPVFVAASQKKDSDDQLSDLFNLIIKINWLVILPIFCLLFSGGGRMLAELSDGNYPNSGLVLLILVGALLPIAVHLTLSMYCLARENSIYPLLATVFAILGLPVGIYLSQGAGAAGMAVTLAISESIWWLTCLFLLQRVSRDAISLDWQGLGRMIIAAIIALGIGLGLDIAGLVWYFVSPIAAFSCVIGFYFLSAFSEQEKQWLIRVLPFAQRVTKVR